MPEEATQRVADLFEAALREDPANRPEFLAKACGADQELWDEVSSLVAEFERRGETSNPEQDGWPDNNGRDTESGDGPKPPIKLIGRYEAGRVLGRGGMGIVYEAFDPVLGRRIALKTIRIADSGTPSERGWLRARLLREARTAASLEHPNIVRVYDSGIEGELAYIAMELVEGPTLERRMRAAGLQPGEALEILRQAAAALDYSHSTGVIHRDIKPTNIMLHRGTIVKVADFGIAKTASGDFSTRTTVTAGTPGYMSPEQIRRRHVDGRSDQFSLAVVAFEMLTGVRPFVAESDFDLLRKIVDGDPQPVSSAAPHLPATLEGAFQRAFAKNSEARYPACGEFVSALEEAMNPAESTDRALPGQVDGVAAPIHTDTKMTRRRSSSWWNYLSQRRWVVSAAFFALLLLLAWPAARVLLPRQTPKAPPTPTPAPSAPLNTEHIVLNQDFERLALRKEAYLDHRLSNPNRNAGPFTQRNLPSQVRGMTGVVAMSGGWGQSVALKSDGSIWTWGWEALGTVKDLKRHPDPAPLQGRPQSPFRSIASGVNYYLAVAEDGTVWGWGYNLYCQLGDGTRTSRKTPVRVGSLTDVAAIAAYGLRGLALKRDGTVWSWGRDTLSAETVQCVPARVTRLENIAAISTGQSFNLALKKDGSVWAWGQDPKGPTGEGAINQRPTPLQVAGLTGVAAVAAGSHHAVALKNDGTVWTWGPNQYGELGDGSQTDRWTPMKVQGLDHVVAIAAGAQNTMALRSDGTVWAWGHNYYGVLGDGTRKDRHTPGQVHGLSDVVAIADGGEHGLARRRDGTLWSWGWNDYGQLGRQAVQELESTGTTSATIDFVRVSGPMYALPGDGFPWILLDRATHRILLQPGDFATSQWGASLGLDVAAQGRYAIRGAFQRAGSNPIAGGAEDVAIFLDDDVNHPLWTKHIAPADLASHPFSVSAHLLRGQVVRFVVFSGPRGKDGNSDETSLVATIDRHGND
jgi:serine/threonine protein kinase/alpha-tubulin suppressor-like RCC1 family protein